MRVGLAVLAVVIVISIVIAISGARATYAFQHDNGTSVREYAAELAVRYFAEQREMLSAHQLARPAFKCGPAENARAWQALIDEFFAGRDLVPGC